MENQNVSEVAQNTMKNSGGGGNLTNCDFLKVGEYTKEFFKYYKEVYSFFDDEISKNIFIKFFECRLLNRFDGMVDFSSKFVQDEFYQRIKLEKEKRLYKIELDFSNNNISIYDLPIIEDNQTIVIYCAAKIGKELVKYYKKTNKIVLADCYYDTIVCFEGIPVISEEDAFIKYPNAKYFLATAIHSATLYNKLLENGIPESNIIVNDFVADIENQYFDFFKPKENEIFVDCGVYDAANSIQFTKWDKDYEKIYLFEPDENNYIKSKENLDKYNIKNYELSKKGVWNEKNTLFFDNDGSSSSINLLCESGIEIEVDTLDKLLNGEKVTFIKMDIEGIELKALQGAEQTIKEYKPRLAISVYHKVEDILEIPLYLKSILPEYKFALRHYTSKFSETVLYAWVE